jgi:hypothetical protein
MSRIRSIHPGLWTDEAFVGLSAMSRLFLMGLWNECDDMGSFAWSPLGLKMKILPADAVDAKEMLSEIQAAGIIIQYEVAGKHYGAVRNFCQYQRPKKPNSSYPQTEEIKAWVNLDARHKRDGSEDVENQSGTGGEKARQMEDGGGEDKEGSSGEEPKSRKRASDFELPEWVPEEPWKAFVEMRRAIPKVPFTLRAAKEIVGDLERLRSEGHDPGKVLLLAVKRGWRGVFGDNTTTGPVAAKPPKELTVEELHSAIRFRRDIGDEERAQGLESELRQRLAA